MDQGAYNQYYEATVRPSRLSESFNAKPYKPFNPDAFIVHFHGPKPMDYLNYFDNGLCVFGGLCKKGVDVGGLCSYILEWVSFVHGLKEKHVLEFSCKAPVDATKKAVAPIVKQARRILFAQRW